MRIEPAGLGGAERFGRMGCQRRSSAPTRFFPACTNSASTTRKEKCATGHTGECCERKQDARKIDRSRHAAPSFGRFAFGMSETRALPDKSVTDSERLFRVSERCHAPRNPDAKRGDPK